VTDGRTPLAELRRRERIVRVTRAAWSASAVLIVIVCVTLDLPMWIGAVGAFGSPVAALIDVGWIGQMRGPRCDVWFRWPPPEGFCESCGFALETPRG
jgi:hypothetical protein